MNSILTSKGFIKTSFGNVIEWYDFSLYGIFAVSIAKTFFPNYSQFLSLLMTFLTYSISFVARPVGALLFGYIGDRMGKRYSVNLSIWCMAIPTVLISFLPTYAQIGSTAPILLMLLRFIQGVSTGGQFSGLITIAVENSNQSRSYFIGIILSISMLGSLLASVVSLLFDKVFYIISLEHLAWRAPFLLSALLFISYLKMNPEIEKENIPSKYKLSDIFKEQPYEMLYMTLLAAILGAIYYLLFGFSITFMKIHLAIGGEKPLYAMNILFFVALISYPIFGKLADNFVNRVEMSKRFTLILAVAIIFLSSRLDFFWVLNCLIAMVIFDCAISAYMTSMFAEIFHEKYRMTACSICYSSGIVLGGFGPPVAEIVTKGSPSGFYMLLLSLSFALYLILDKVTETRGYKNYILSLN